MNRWALLFENEDEQIIAYKAYGTSFDSDIDDEEQYEIVVRCEDITVTTTFVDEEKRDERWEQLAALPPDATHTAINDVIYSGLPL